MAYLSPEERAFGIGFLERLEADTKPSTSTQSPELWDVLESVKRNISNVLNSRAGGAQSAPELGLVDFNDARLSNVDLSVRIQIAIQLCLETYEPRLKNITVSSEPELGMILKFQIAADLNSETLRESVQFQLMLDQNKKYKVY